MDGDAIKAMMWNIDRICQAIRLATLYADPLATLLVEGFRTIEVVIAMSLIYTEEAHVVVIRYNNASVELDALGISIGLKIGKWQENGIRIVPLHELCAACLSM
jgi:hypothetical protein